MATATTITERVEIPQPPTVLEQVTGYDLALTREEAQTLHDLIYLAVGVADGARPLIGIMHALHSAGVQYPRVDAKPGFAVRVYKNGVQHDYRPGHAYIAFTEPGLLVFDE